MTDLDAKIYFDGNYAPVTEEVTVADLPVVGHIPDELEGRLLRNGPNPAGEVDMAEHHWFLGDGMVHGLRLRGGKAEWYRNRFVGSERTADLLDITSTSGRLGRFGPNTNVIGHAGKTLAIVEGGIEPVELTYELDTVGPDDFGGTLLNGYTAHPKYDPLTGEMHAMCWLWPDLEDHVQYVVIDADGTMTKTVNVTTPTMPMIHDMGLTQKYAIVLDLPVAVDIEAAMEDKPFPVRWYDDYNARVGLLPRDAADESSIVWCEVDPCFAFHPLNSYDLPDGRVIMDICVYRRIFDRDRNGPFRDSLPILERWTIDPATARVHREVTDDRSQEFPRVAGRVLNLEHRFGYTAGFGPAGGFEDAPVELDQTHKYDFANGTTESHDHGAGRQAGEPVFVSRHGAEAEDDGWIITTVYDANTDTSDIVILNAGDIAGDEVARVQLPVRIPHGFHGNWVRDSVTPPPA